MNRIRSRLDTLQLAFTVLGIGVAGYLTYVKLFGIKPYCAGVGDCEAVQTSPYAMLFGVPVAIWGLLTYFALLALVLLKRNNWRNMGHLLRQGIFLITLVGVLFSAYLTYLEVAVIHAICPWCVVSAILMVLLFILAIKDAFSVGDDDFEEETS